jgi:hypothetical protein
MNTNIVTRMRNAIRSTGVDASQNGVAIYNDPRAGGVRRLKANFYYSFENKSQAEAVRHAVITEFGTDMTKIDVGYCLCIFVKPA